MTAAATLSLSGDLEKRHYLWLGLYLCWLLGPFIFLLFSAIINGDFESVANLDQRDYRRWWELSLSTLRLTIGASLLATILGVCVALAIHQTQGLHKRVLTVLFPIPLLLPPMVVAVSWTHLLGKRGIAAALWTQFTGSSELPFSIYGEWGSIGVLALCWYPLVTMPTLVGLRALGPAILHSGRIYASPWRRRLHIDLPLLLPYISAGSAFVAWLALADFDVPAVFLRNAFPMEIYNAFQIDPRLGQALVACLPLLLISFGVLFFRAIFLFRSVQAVTLNSRWMGQSASATVAASRSIARVAWGILFVSVVLPVLSLAHQTNTLQQLEAGLETAGHNIVNSFQVASLSALLMLALALPFARMLQRATKTQRLVLLFCVLLPLAIPGTIHGLAWQVCLNRSEPGRALLEYPQIVALMNAARFFPLAVFLTAATVNALDERLMHPARLLSANRFNHWWRIAVPLIYPGLFAAFCIGFALAAGELAATIMVNPVGFTTLPLRISSLLHFGKDEMLAGLLLTQIVLAVMPYLAASIMLERSLEVRFD